MSLKKVSHAIFAVALIFLVVGQALSDPTNGVGDDADDGKSPKIIFHSPASSTPILYEKGLRLECHAKAGTRLNWRWLRNGMDIRAGDGYVQSKANDNTNLAHQSSIIELAPTDDLVSSYTCVAESRLGVDRHSFTVRKPNVAKEEKIRMDERNRLFQTYILPLMQVMLLLAIGAVLIPREKGGDKMDTISVGKLANDLFQKLAEETGPAQQADGNKEDKRKSISGFQTGNELRSRRGQDFVKGFPERKTTQEGSSKLIDKITPLAHPKI